MTLPKSFNGPMVVNIYGMEKGQGCSRKNVTPPITFKFFVGVSYMVGQLKSKHE